MSTFEEYRRTQVDMVHLVSHLMRLHRLPGHSESTPEQREVYDLIHFRFLETLHLAQTRLAGIDQAAVGIATKPNAAPRSLAQIREEARLGKTRAWGKMRQRRTSAAPSRPFALKGRPPVGDPFAEADDAVQRSSTLH